MRSIISRSNRHRLLNLTPLALAAMLAPVPLAAQEIPEESAPTPPTDPEAAQIVAEIEAIAGGDPSADPEGDLAKLAELRARAKANGKVPLTDLGVLESQFGAAYFYLRDFEKALPYFDAAADLFRRGNAPLEEIAGLYNNQAAILASLARYPESEEYHRKALAIRREIEGERGPFVASSLFGLGHIAYRQGRVLEALDYLRPAAEQTLEFLGPEDMLTSLRLTSLASVLGRAGYDNEAIETARLAVRLSRENLGEDHQLYGVAVNNLGHALMQARLLGEAIPVLREALRIRVETVGEDASGTAVGLRNLSQALMLDGKAEEAETLQRRAVEIYEQTGEVENPFALATMYSALAEHYAMRGDWAGYDELADKAVASADAAIDDESVEQALIHLHRAQWWMRRARTAEALAEAEHWVPVVREAFIETHEDRIWTELLLARMDAAGVGAAVVVQPINHKFDHAYVARALRRHPERLVGILLADPTPGGGRGGAAAARGGGGVPGRAVQPGPVRGRGDGLRRGARHVPGVRGARRARGLHDFQGLRPVLRVHPGAAGPLPRDPRHHRPLRVLPRGGRARVHAAPPACGAPAGARQALRLLPGQQRAGPLPRHARDGGAAPGGLRPGAPAAGHGLPLRGGRRGRVRRGRGRAARPGQPQRRRAGLGLRRHRPQTLRRRRVIFFFFPTHL